MLYFLLEWPQKVWKHALVVCMRVHFFEIGMMKEDYGKRTQEKDTHDSRHHRPSQLDLFVSLIGISRLGDYFFLTANSYCQLSVCCRMTVSFRQTITGFLKAWRLQWHTTYLFTFTVPIVRMEETLQGISPEDEKRRQRWIRHKVFWG